MPTEILPPIEYINAFAKFKLPTPIWGRSPDKFIHFITKINGIDKAFAENMFAFLTGSESAPADVYLRYEEMINRIINIAQTKRRAVVPNLPKFNERSRHYCRRIYV